MSGKLITFTHYIERSDAEFALDVAYTCSPLVAASYWQPAEGGEIELVSVTRCGAPFALTDTEEAVVVQACADRAAQDMEDARTDAEQYRRDQLRDNGWLV